MDGVVCAPEPHHLEGERFLAEIVRRVEPNRQIDLPEGLDALARHDAMKRRRAGSQLVEPDPHQPYGVHVEDIEAAASVHQHLGEPHIVDDQIDDQRVPAWIGDAVQVILTTDGDGVPRPVEEGGGSPLRSEDIVPLPLAVGHVHGRSPEDEEDVLHRRENTSVTVTAILLGLAILRGGATVVFLEHVTMLEGVVDRCLVAWARLL
jgi:hypothetical protein